MINKTTLRQSLILFTAALIWGFTFVAQSVGMDYMGPFTFIAMRNIVALMVLLPMAAIMDRHGKKQPRQTDRKKNNRLLLFGGVCCGICLFLGSTLQQFGVRDTTVGKAGFISALYMVLVPLLGIFLGKKIGLRIWAAVGLAAFVVSPFSFCPISSPTNPTEHSNDCLQNQADDVVMDMDFLLPKAVHQRTDGNAYHSED